MPGEFLSAQRWYWAVITVFVMFSSTQSRGDVLEKGMQRVIGTPIGVGAGILIATAVAGHYASAAVASPVDSRRGRAAERGAGAGHPNPEPHALAGIDEAIGRLAQDVRTRQQGAASEPPRRGGEPDK